jgi:predicted O-methyltransferase YrrM
MMTPEELVDWVNNVPELGSTPLGKGPDVPAHLSIYTRSEMMLLAKYATRIPKHGVAVEIGVYVGHTASILLNLQEALVLDVVLIDNWTWMMPDARDSFDKLIRESFSETPFQGFWMLSSEARVHFAAQMAKPSIDYIHIDGNHNYDGTGVDLDCKLWLPLLKPGGVVAFHDHDHEPVARAVAEFCPGWAGEEAQRTAVRIKP